MYGGGIDPATSLAYGFAEFGTGGMGGRLGKDGVDVIQTDTSNAQNIPVEALELEAPLRVGYYRLRRDSAGPGKFRGGVGFEKSITALRGELHVSHRGERHYTAPWGVFGGEAAERSRSTIVHADGGEQEVPSKLDFLLSPGDELRLWTTGGGGYGDPLEREPASVLEDVLDGKVSVGAAAERYGVVIAGNAVEDEATRELRARLAAERGPVTWTYDRGPLGRE
jgi:N-methylhydantoinase B